MAANSGSSSNNRFNNAYHHLISKPIYSDKYSSYSNRASSFPNSQFSSHMKGGGRGNEHRKICKCGYLFLAPEGTDFTNAHHRNRRWQRRWFILYDDGELAYALDDYFDTAPQGIIDMKQVLNVEDCSHFVGHNYSLKISTAARHYYIRAATRDEFRWWYDVLVMYPRKNAVISVAPSNGVKGGAQRKDAYPKRSRTVPHNQLSQQQLQSVSNQLELVSLSIDPSQKRTYFKERPTTKLHTSSNLAAEACNKTSSNESFRKCMSSENLLTNKEKFSGKAKCNSAFDTVDFIANNAKWNAYGHERSSSNVIVKDSLRPVEQNKPYQYRSALDSGVGSERGVRGVLESSENPMLATDAYLTPSSASDSDEGKGGTAKEDCKTPRYSLSQLSKNEVRELKLLQQIMSGRPKSTSRGNKEAGGNKETDVHLLSSHFRTSPESSGMSSGGSNVSSSPPAVSPNSASTNAKEVASSSKFRSPSIFDEEDSRFANSVTTISSPSDSSSASSPPVASNRRDKTPAQMFSSTTRPTIVSVQLKSPTAYSNLAYGACGGSSNSAPCFTAVRAEEKLKQLRQRSYDVVQTRGMNKESNTAAVQTDDYAKQELATYQKMLNSLENRLKDETKNRSQAVDRVEALAKQRQTELESLLRQSERRAKELRERTEKLTTDLTSEQEKRDKSERQNKTLKQQIEEAKSVVTQLEKQFADEYHQLLKEKEIALQQAKHNNSSLEQNLREANVLIQTRINDACKSANFSPLPSPTTAKKLPNSTYIENFSNEYNIVAAKFLKALTQIKQLNATIEEKNNKLNQLSQKHSKDKVSTCIVSEAFEAAFSAYLIDSTPPSQLIQRDDVATMTDQSNEDEHLPRLEKSLLNDYIQLQRTYQLSLRALQKSHTLALNQLQNKHKSEIRKISAEKEEELANEAQYTASAIESLKKAHKEELVINSTKIKSEYENLITQLRSKIDQLSATNGFRSAIVMNRMCHVRQLRWSMKMRESFCNRSCREFWKCTMPNAWRILLSPKG